MITFMTSGGDRRSRDRFVKLKGRRTFKRNVYEQLILMEPRALDQTQRQLIIINFFNSRRP